MTHKIDAELTAMHFEPIPTVIRGVAYASQAEAAAALGVHYSTVSKAVDDGCPDRVGLSPRGRRVSKPVTINGVWYRSATYAARHVGWSVDTILRRMAKHGDVLSTKFYT